ncbi:hypothetical protein Ahy_A05g025661 isoform D [Arachis hypogaea]|uniref:Uncharacterized protein n=1 Tax=Arachis hypogaea TaxID=3818 RepID=A0A445D969_ARAHY|nr:hypothetical protein Ahy_A05g025661 isoform D [Arachis hypogaea]
MACYLLIVRVSRMNIKKQQSMQRAMRVCSEAVYAYGTGNDKHGVELLGPDFDAMDYKERAYKLANRPEAEHAKAKAKALEESYFN